MTAKLTPKEYRVVVMYGRGLSCKEIGADLGTSEQVIKNVLGVARGKTGARTSTQLAVMVALQRERMKQLEMDQVGR